MTSYEFALISASLEAQKCENLNTSERTLFVPSKTRSALKTLKRIFHSFWSLYPALFLQYIMPFISIAFSGHFNTDTLAATGLANSVINITGIAVGAGLATAFDTLAPQTLGAKKSDKVGVLLQRLLMIMFLMSCLIIAFWINIDGLLKLCHEPITVAKQTRLYLLIFIPGLYALFLYRSLRSYTQVQGFTKPSIITCFVCVILHIIFNYVFIFTLDLGLVGAALATTLSMICMSILIILYIRVSKLYLATWHGFTFQSFLEWTSFTKLALLGMLALLFELVFNELTVILMGLEGPKEIGAQAVLFQIKFAITLAPLGWGLSACYLVGEELGRGNPKAALTIIRYSLVVCLLFGCAFCIIVYLCRDLLGRAFSGDADVQKLISDVALLAGGCVWAESAHFCLIYGIQGIGKPLISVICVGIGSYLVGLPISVLLTFRVKMGLKGMWIGICSGVFTQALLEAISLFCFVDFTKASIIAQEKAGVHPSKHVEYGSLGNSTHMNRQEKEPAQIHDNASENNVLEDETVNLIVKDSNYNISYHVGGKESCLKNTQIEIVEKDEEWKVTKGHVKKRCLLFLAAFLVLFVSIIVRCFCYDV